MHNFKKRRHLHAFLLLITGEQKKSNIIQSLVLGFMQSLYPYPLCKGFYLSHSLLFVFMLISQMKCGFATVSLVRDGHEDVKSIQTLCCPSP